MTTSPHPCPYNRSEDNEFGCLEDSVARLASALLSRGDNHPCQYCEAAGVTRVPCVTHGCPAIARAPRVSLLAGFDGGSGAHESPSAASSRAIRPPGRWAIHRNRQPDNSVACD